MRWPSLVLVGAMAAASGRSEALGSDALESDPPRFCPTRAAFAADAVTLTAQLAPGSQWVEIWSEGARSRLLMTLGEPHRAALEAALEGALDGVGTALRCVTGSAGADCDVSVTGAALVNASAIAVTFSGDTSMPPAGLRADMSAFLRLSGPWMGRLDLVGRWATPATLHVAAAAERGAAGAGTGAAAAGDDGYVPPSAEDRVMGVPNTRASLVAAAAAAAAAASGGAGPTLRASATLRLVRPGSFRAVLCGPEAPAPGAPASPPDASRPCAGSLGAPVGPGAPLRILSRGETANGTGGETAGGSCGHSDDVLVTVRGAGRDATPATAVSLALDPEAEALPPHALRADVRGVAVVPLAAHAEAGRAGGSGEAGSPTGGGARAAAAAALAGGVLPPLPAAPGGPVMAWRGVLATGARSVRVPAAALPASARAHGDYSVCAWFHPLVRSMAAPGPRGLFLKGWGSDQQRTASAWVEPGTGRVLFGVSTTTDPAVEGAAGNSLLPGVWTHVCLTVENQTQAALAASLASGDGAPAALAASLASGDGAPAARTDEVAFRLRVFVNGHAASTLTTREVPAVANAGPLWVGGDPGHPGHPSLVAGLRVFGRALAISEVANLHDATAPLLAWADDVGRGDGAGVEAPWSQRHEGSMHGGGESGWTGPEARAVAAAAAAAAVSRLQRDLAGSADIVTTWSLTHAEAADMVDRAAELMEDCGTDPETAVELLDEACHGGEGSAAACEALSEWLLQPGRSACRGEVTRFAAASRGAATGDDDGFSRVVTAAGAVEAAGGRGVAARPSLLTRDVGTAARLAVSAAARGRAGAAFRVAVLAGAGAWHPAPGSRGQDDPASEDRAAGFGGRLATASARFTGSSPRGALLAAAAAPGTADDAAAWGAAAVSTGLLHVAAALGSDAAWHALGVRYGEGSGAAAPRCPLVAAQYLTWSADVAESTHTTRGTQPLHEMHRLTPETAEEVVEAQAGDEDATIEAQRSRAERGDPVAMLHMGDLHYWGARGLRRDQGLARRYFERAAAAGNLDAKAAAAGMMLKGEGGGVDSEGGRRLFEEAAALNHTGALNGLGFAAFNGQGVERNISLARDLFCRARDEGAGGDAAFNCARCVEMGDPGAGTPPDVAGARELYLACARSAGHFLCIYRAGASLASGLPADPVADAPSAADLIAAASLHAPGLGADSAARLLLGSAAAAPSAPVNAESALLYLRPASDVGPWAAVLRRAFDRYRLRDYDGALLAYAEAWTLGFELGPANAAYLLRRRLASPSAVVARGTGRAPGPEADAAAADAAARRGFESSIARGGWASAAPLGEMRLAGAGGAPRDERKGAALLSRAAASGNARAAYGLALLHERGGGSGPASEARALRYLQRVLEVAPAGSGHEAPVYVALGRIHARRVLRSWGLPVPSWLGPPAAPGGESGGDGGGDVVSEWLAWSLDARTDTETRAGEAAPGAPDDVASAGSYGEVEDVDAGTALGAYRGQAASLWWVARRLLGQSLALQAAVAGVAAVSVALLVGAILYRCPRCWGQ